MLAIITYNVQLGKKIPSIIKLINNLSQSDILCFQEFPEKSINDLNDNIGRNYKYQYVSSLRKGGHAYGQLTLYNSKKLVARENKLVNLQKSFFEKLFFPNSINRKALITTFEINSKQFILVNVHLTAFHFNALRRSQIKDVINSLKDQPKDVPQIFLGDLNYSSLIRRKKLLDLMLGFGFQNAYKLKTHRLFLIKHQLDYVFYKNCLVINPEVLKIEYSDHYAVRFKTQLG